MSDAPEPVHVVLPYWGDPALLDLAVESVLAQDDAAWTLAVIDDCYPDDTARLRYEHHPDPRVTYQRNEENLGVAGNFERSRQVAVAQPKPSLCVFLGCDDAMDPHFVSRVRELARRYPEATIFQPSVRVVDGAGHPARNLAERAKSWLTPTLEEPTVLGGEALAASLLHGNWLYWPALVFRTQALEHHTFRADLPLILDLALILDLVLEGATLVLDPVVSFTYRRHEASASSTGRFGQRFADEARFLDETATRLDHLGWRRARRAARLRTTSRLHAMTLIPGALTGRDWHQARTLLVHACGR